MGRFDSKNVLITGGGTGIGSETARKFASEGANVIVAHGTADAGKSVVRRISELGGQAIFQKFDITDEGSVCDLHANIVDQFGRIHAAFNNVCIEDDAAPVEEQDNAAFERVMNVNVRGVWYCMKEQIRHMRAQDGGAIVNNASIAGLIGFPQHAPYVASMHAVMGLTKTAAVEYGHCGIRVNAVCSGAVENPALNRFAKPDGIRDAMIAMHPIGRLGVRKEIADAVVWLCSEEATFVLGQGIVVDGGFTAR